jgi:repressor LexA
MESYLTPKQKQILEWIEQYLKENQTMPSRREIANGLGLSSPATIQQHIEAIKKTSNCDISQHHTSFVQRA